MSCIRVAQLNAQRSVTVLQELRKLIEEMKLDVLCLQEPYSRSGSIPHLPVTARVIKEGEMPMAVIVVLNKQIKVLRISQLCNSHSICLEINYYGKMWILVNSYFQYGEDLDLDMFRRVGEAYRDVPVIYMADANAKSPWWYSQFRDRKGEEIEEFISGYNLIIENKPLNPPTYINRAGASSNIDITLANLLAHETVFGWTVGDGLTSSDHNMIYFDLLRREGERVKDLDEIRIRNFNYKKADWEKLKLSLMVPTEVVTGDNVDRKAREMTVALRAAMNHSIPTVLPLDRDQYRPWSDFLQNLRRKVRRARRIYQRARVEADRRKYLCTYIQLKKEFKEQLNAKRLESWQEFVEKNLALDAWGTPYRLITNKIRRPDVISTLRRGDGGMTEGWRESLECLMGELLPSDDIENETIEQKDLRQQMLVDNLGGVVCPFSLEEVTAAILQQKPKKAAGPDRIKSEVLHHLVVPISPFLLGLFNECLIQGRIPSCFKEADVVILSKGEDRDPKLAKSYRPICLLNIIGKVQERLLCKRLREHRLLKGMVENQFGFRKGRSTEDAINFALEAVHISDQKYVVGIFIDIAGAFDNLWWPYLFSRLRRMECPRSLYLSLLDYCKGRKVKLLIDRTVNKIINKGCPQGSILGPDFWDVGLEPLLEILNNLEVVKLTVAYADDLLLLIEANSRIQLEYKCQQALEIVNNWCLQAKLKVAASKTTYMFLKGSMRRNPMIRIGQVGISRQNVTKYLGVHLDESLSFRSHVEMMRTKAEKIMMKLIGIGQRRFYLPLKIVSLYHNAVLSSIVGYAAGVWAHRARLDRIKLLLRRTQRKILLRFVGAFGTTSTMALLVILGIWPLDLQVRLRGANYWHKKGNLLKAELIVGRRVLDKKDIYNSLVNEWQREWDDMDVGRRTHEIFPSVRLRLKIDHFQPGRGLVQYITGHGPYGVYLHRFGQKQSKLCEVCNVDDTPEHALFECVGRPVWDMDIRMRLTGLSILAIIMDKVLWSDLDSWTGAFSKAAQIEYGSRRGRRRVCNLEEGDMTRRRSLRLLERVAPDARTLQDDRTLRDRTDFEGDIINRRRIFVQSMGRTAAAEIRRGTD